MAKRYQIERDTVLGDFEYNQFLCVTYKGFDKFWKDFSGLGCYSIGVSLEGFMCDVFGLELCCKSFRAFVFELFPAGQPWSISVPEFQYLIEEFFGVKFLRGE